MIHLPDAPATVTSVTSLDDRRKIRSLEKQVDDLTQRLTDALGQVKPALSRTINDCRHLGTGYEVSDNVPEVRCKGCNGLVDPYDVLREIAHEEVAFCYRSNELRAEAARLAKEVESLKGKRARLRAQVTKATPDIPMAEIESAIEAANADGIEIRQVGGQWGAWIMRWRKPLIASGAFRSIREAVTDVIDRAKIKAAADAEPRSAR